VKTREISDRTGTAMDCATVIPAALYANNSALHGRDTCRGFLEAIRSALSGSRNGDGILLVDLSGIREVGCPVVVELLGLFRQAAQSNGPARYLLVKLDQLHGEPAETLACIANVSGIPLPAVDHSGSSEILGVLTLAERTTFASVMQTGSMTSSQLGDSAKLPLSAASNRLRRLYTLRLIRREERIISGVGGREFVYLPLI